MSLLSKGLLSEIDASEHRGTSAHSTAGPFTLAQIDYPRLRPKGNETRGFFPLNPFFPLARTRMSRETVSSAGRTVLNGFRLWARIWCAMLRHFLERGEFQSS